MTALGMYNANTGHAWGHFGPIALTYPDLPFGSFGDYFLYRTKSMPMYAANTNIQFGSWGTNGMFSLVSPSDDTIIYCHAQPQYAFGEPAGEGVIEKLNNFGEIQWSYGGSQSVSGGDIWHMAYLPNGNIVGVGNLIDADYNILILTPDGEFVQSLVATLRDKDQALLRVAVDLENNTFTAVGNQDDLSGNNDIIFHYTWNSSTEEYEEEWTSGINQGDNGRDVDYLPSGDILVGVTFRPFPIIEDANYATYILDPANGSVIQKFHPFRSTWEEHDGEGTGFYWNHTVDRTNELLVDIDGGAAFYVSTTQGTFHKYIFNGATWVTDSSPALPSGYEEPRHWSRTWTKQKYFCYMNSPGGPNMVNAVFNASDDTFQKLYTNTDASDQGIHIQSSRLTTAPKIMTTGSGHFYPLFTPDNSAFIDHTIPKGWPVDSGVDNDYSDGDVVVMDRFRRRTAFTSLSPFIISAVSEALRDGNYSDDLTEKAHYPDARWWLKYSETGPEPIQQINTYTRTDNVVYHEGSYYKAKSSDASDLANYPPNATYWTPVSAPDQRWDDFAGYGGDGYRAPTPSLSPQVYTLVFADILDDNSDPHLANGVYHCVKHYSTDAEWYGVGRYRFDTLGWLGNKNKLRVEYVSQYDDTNDELFETIITFKLDDWDIDQWEAGTYNQGDIVQRNGTFYSVDTLTTSEEPPHSDWSALPGRPTGEIFSLTYDQAYNNSYGSVMSDDLASNELTDDSTYGHDGTVSFYPGKYKLWTSAKTYTVGSKVTFGNDFYIADNENANSEPPSADWTKQN